MPRDTFERRCGVHEACAAPPVSEHRPKGTGRSCANLVSAVTQSNCSKALHVYVLCTGVYAVRVRRSVGTRSWAIRMNRRVAMAQQKISDEQWAAVRKRYESEPGLGYGALAQSLDCSKNLVARKAKEQHWQKSIEASLATAKNGRAIGSKVTESAVHAATRAPSVYSNPAAESPPQPVRVLSRDSTASASQSEVLDRPPFASWEREVEWIEQQVVARQRALMERHERELRALTAAIYDGLKKIDKKGIGEASRAANALSTALQRKHAMELGHEAARTRIELGVLHGASGPRPARIVVHMVPGAKIGDVSITYGPHAVAVDGRSA